MEWDASPMTPGEWHRRGHRLAFGVGDAEFAQFGAADSAALYEIRNHPTVRPFMPSPDPVPVERHDAWVRSNLIDTHDKSPLIVIGRASGQPVAFGLLKPTAEAGVLEVGVLVAGAWQRGTLPPRLGAALFTIAARIFGTHTLVSYVNHGHAQALRLNRGAGLLAEAQSDKPGETAFRTPMSVALSTPIYRRCARTLVIHVHP